MKLTNVQQKFISHWGEMGTKWGISRSEAQIHALLYLADKPLNADEITETLGIARSNVSMSLKELKTWRIIRTAPTIGDRREHFETLSEVWEMFHIILEERKRREIEPTIALLNECLQEARKKDRPATIAKLEDIQEFFVTTLGWYSHVSKLPRKQLVKFMNAGGRIAGWLN